MRRLGRASLAGLAALVLPSVGPAAGEQLAGPARNFAGSVQLDYLAVTHRQVVHDRSFDGPTLELSLKLAADLTDKLTANVKVCFACHGFEVGMAYIDFRRADALNLRAGRFTPAFGSFPLRHDPANHRTGDKPLPYDMGRMIRFRDWNEGILPAPWVDNGIEINGTQAVGKQLQLDYAVYAIAGPKGSADGFDFDYTLSRSPERYYVDNNSEPSFGGRLSATLNRGDASFAVGGSAMAGHYDPQAKLRFSIWGSDATLQLPWLVLRAEYLVRRTQIAIGSTPELRFKYSAGASGRFADEVIRDGFYAEAELPLGRIDLLARWDGLRQFGNVAAASPLRSTSIVLRYTGALAVRLADALRLKASIEQYDFSDFTDEIAVHLGLTTIF